MDIVIMAAAVTAIVQKIKGWKPFSTWGPILGFIPVAVFLSVFVGLGVVGYHALDVQHPINLALGWIYTQVVFYANGGHALLKIARGK